MAFSTAGPRRRSGGSPPPMPVMIPMVAMIIVVAVIVVMPIHSMAATRSPMQETARIAIIAENPRLLDKRVFLDRFADYEAAGRRRRRAHRVENKQPPAARSIMMILHMAFVPLSGPSSRRPSSHRMTAVVVKRGIPRPSDGRNAAGLQRPLASIHAMSLATPCRWCLARQRRGARRSAKPRF